MMKLRACHDVVIEWEDLSTAVRCAPPVAGLAAALHRIVLGLWGRPDESSLGKHIAACADQGPDVGYDVDEIYRHGQYLLTNVDICGPDMEHPTLLPGSEPDSDRLTKYFGKKRMEKLKKNAHKEAQALNGNARRGAQRQGATVARAFVPDLEEIKRITRPMNRLHGLSFAIDEAARGSIVEGLHVILAWEAHHVLEAIFQMLCKTFWATLPVRRKGPSWIAPNQDPAGVRSLGVSGWRWSREDIEDLFSLATVYQDTVRWERAFNYCFPCDVTNWRLSNQPYMDIYRHIARKCNGDDITQVRDVLMGKMCGLSCIPWVKSDKWWSATAEEGVILIAHTLWFTPRDRQTAGYRDLKQLLSSERAGRRAGSM